MNRESVKNELATYTKPSFSFEAYAKSTADRAALAIAEKQWRKNMSSDIKGFTKRNHPWTHVVSLDGFKDLIRNAAKN